MTKRHNPYEKLSIEELEELIECYFDCSLSEDDEMSLRKVIAATRYDSPAIREAKAVMGYAAASQKAVRKPQPRRRHVWLRAATSAAAAVALIIGTHAYLNSSADGNGDNVCVAYVNGQRIDNREAIMQMMKFDLLTMQNGSNTVADRIDSDFSAIRDALDELN